MPRTARKRSQADVYHVIMRGDGRRIIFEDDEDRATFLRMLETALDRSGGKAFAWCLMSNHVHLLIQLSMEKLGTMMQSLTSGYAVYYNKRYDHVGHVFAGRFKSEPINDDVYLMTVVKYIHRNPLKGGLCKSCDYKWSSYRHYVNRAGFTSVDFVLGLFGGREAFIASHAAEDGLLKENDINAMAGIPEKRRRLSDEEALDLAQNLLGETRLRNLASESKHARNQAIANLRRMGLTAKQVERATGIGRGIVERVKWRN